MIDSLRAMAIFARVAEAGSFRGAAKLLGVCGQSSCQFAGRTIGDPLILSFDPKGDAHRKRQITAQPRHRDDCGGTDRFRPFRGECRRARWKIECLASGSFDVAYYSGPSCSILDHASGHRALAAFYGRERGPDSIGSRSGHSDGTNTGILVVPAGADN